MLFLVSGVGDALRGLKTCGMRLEGLV